MCYASINKIKDSHYDLVVLDEMHRLTLGNSIFFDSNTVDNILALTATPPLEEEKKDILYNKLKLKITYELPIDKAVTLGLVAPYKIVVVEGYLDNVDKYIESGKKPKIFMQTEYAKYNYLTRNIQKMMFSGVDIPKFMYLARMRFIYNLKSKIVNAKKILEIIPEEDKTLIFCGGIDQSKELCKHTFNSKTDDKDYKKFIKGSINRLAVVNSVNEGHNIPNLDSALIVQLNSNPRDLVQRVGRIIRKREGHEAIIYILCTLATQDENWLEKALEGFDKSNITYINIKNL